MTQHDFWKTTPPDEDEVPEYYFELAAEEIAIEHPDIGAGADEQYEMIAERAFALYERSVREGEEGRAESIALSREMDREMY